MPNRMRIACLVVLLLILVEGISARQAPTASLRWLLTIDKAPATETPGHHVMLGSQREFRIRLAVSNFEGPRVFGVSSLVQTVSVTVKRDGEMQSVDVDAAFGPRTIPVFLSEGEDLAATLTVRRTDSSPWTAGQYAVTVNMAEFLKGLTTESGGPWAGRAKGEETRVLEVQFPRTQDDWSRYYEVEGNSLLGAGKPADAIPYLEQLTRIKPASWQANAALGAAYFRTKRFNDAVTALERATPGWRVVRRQVGDVVPTTLAAAYVALGRQNDAVRVFRDMGLSDRESRERVERVRRGR